MLKYKCRTDFSGYAGGALIPAAQAIHDALVLIIALLPKIPTTLADLQLLITAADDALTKKASKATVDTAAFMVAREALETALAGIGGYVNTVADGDQTLVVSSGFPYYTTGTAPDFSAPAAPTDVVTRHGDVSGEIVVRYHAARSPSMNELQTCTADPMVEANWHAAGMFSGGKATLGGNTPGTTVWVRARTMGLKNVAGDWSDPAKIMAI
jgi:hypothetical protein